MFSKTMQLLNPGAAMGAAADMYAASAAANASTQGAYYQGLGSLGQSLAAERGNMYGANAMAEAARQGALGNIGSAALGAYGSAANASMGAWANNQMAYNRALADMTAANQSSLAATGASRNQALSSLADPYTRAGLGFAGLSTISDPNFAGSFGDNNGWFNAEGAEGGLASGSYRGNSGGSSYLRAGSVDGSRTMGALDNLRGDILSNPTMGALGANYTRDTDRLDSQYYSSRAQPSQMLGQTLHGLLSLSNNGYGQTAAGMNQFYGNQRASGNQFMDAWGGLREDFKKHAPGGQDDSFLRSFAHTTTPRPPPPPKKPSFIGWVPYQQASTKSIFGGGKKK